MIIREAADSDLDDVLSVERAAFGQDEEADLVRDLLGDPSARPVVSLIVYEDTTPAGHILFSAAHLADTADSPPLARIFPRLAGS